jgi:hypothetical protein
VVLSTVGLGLVDYAAPTIPDDELTTLPAAGEEVQ